MQNQFTDLILNLPIKNTDLLSVGIAIAGICILGMVIFLNDRKSITNKSFLFLALTASVWSIFNYLNYQSDSPEVVLLLLRLLMFFAACFALALFQLLYVFPKAKVDFPKWYRHAVLPLSAIVLCITLTPLVFNHIVGEVKLGQVAAIAVGPGIIPFALLVFFLVGGGIFNFIKKTLKVLPEDKKQFEIVLVGIIITFTAIILLNFVLPAFFSNYTFIPLGALFIFPFVAFTSYAIYKHHLFNIKVAAVAFVAFILTAFSFFNILYAASASQIAINITFFVAILLGSIILIQSILREIEQREHIESLNSQLDSVIHLISHEVKGALAKSRMVFTEIAEGDYGKASPEMTTLVQTADGEVKKTVDMVMDILNSANVKKGTLTIDKASFDMKEAVIEVVASLKAEADEKGLYIRTEIPEGTQFTINADREKIVQHVIRNLIDNSIKYTPTGGLTVALSGGSKGPAEKNFGKVLLSIKDTGVGITPEDMPRMFTEGGKGKESTKVNVHSTGYGLYFAKNVVEAHGGRIWVESEGAEKGSQFYVEFTV
jgi:signal transduction histidine kinase